VYEDTPEKPYVHEHETGKECPACRWEKLSDAEKEAEVLTVCKRWFESHSLSSLPVKEQARILKERLRQQFP